VFFVGLYKPSYCRLIKTTKEHAKWPVRALSETLEEAYVLASQQCSENVNGRRPQQRNNQDKQAKVDAPAALPVTEEQHQKTATAATGQQPPPFVNPNSALAVAGYLREGDALLDTGCTDHIVRDKSIHGLEKPTTVQTFSSR